MKLSSLVVIPSQFARRRIYGTALLALFGTVLASSTVFAASGNTSPISVVGVVEEINDVLRVPYSRNFAIAAAGPTAARATFDIPDGKRFVIEAVSYDLAIKDNVYFSVALAPLIGGIRAPHYLSAQSHTMVSREGDPTRGTHTGTHPMKLRVDAKPGMNNEIEVVVTRQNADTSSVDIPTP
jgi:hypothetical protein